MDQETKVIMARVAKLGEMSESEAHRIVNETYKDGIVSRGEAEALFRLNDVLKSTDPQWSSRFQEALKDYLLTREPPEGWVTDEEADWLLAQVQTDGDRPSLDEIDLLLSVLRHADGAPEKLSKYTLEAISARIVADGVANLNMVERMRFALYAGAGDGGLWVTQYEASVLFKTNDAVANARNASTWNDLFARAIGNHLMAFTSGNWFESITYNGRKAAKARQIAAEAANREAENVTEEENSWLLKRLGWDGDISPAEASLIEFLKKEAPGFAQGQLSCAF